MTNLQDMFDTAHPQTFTVLKRTAEQNAKSGIANSKKTRTPEQRAHLSAVNKGKTIPAETRAKISANSKQAKPLMTPHGIFPSKAAVAKAAGTYIEKVTYWMKKYPNDFYFINKGE